MTQSTLISKLSRLGLLSVLCTGLFLATGELSMSTDGSVQIGNGWIYNAMAEDTTKTANPVDATVNTLATLGNIAIGTLTFLITPLIMLAGWLLSPDWTFGDVFLLRPVLHNLWILVSNVVYVIFGFLLVFVAFANIFGGESAKTYEMKTMLPKLLTGMLMVPFTWFIVSGVLSVTNILTASVIQLPTSSIIGNATFLDKKIVPKGIWYTKGVDYGKGDTANVNNPSQKDYFKWNGSFAATNCNEGSSWEKANGCLSIREILAGGGGAYNLLSVYAYGIFNIQDFKELTPGKWINAVIDIVIQLGFWAIFFVIFGILVIAIVYALFTRATMLWLYAMFSPLFALNYVFWDKFKDKGVDKFTIKEFISLALVPVYVSAALAFGLLFLGAVMGITGPEDGKFESSVVKVEVPKDPTGETTFSFLGANGENGVTLHTKGLLDSESQNQISGVFNKGRSIIGTIIVNTLALVILWMAVMAALGASTITKEAVAPIHSFGKSIWELATKAPQYVPIPLPGGKSMTMSWMQQFWSGINSKITTMAQWDWNASGQTFGEHLWNKIGLQSGEMVKAIQQQTQAIIDNKAGLLATASPDNKATAIKAIMTLPVKAEQFVWSEKLKGSFIEQLKTTYSLKDEDVKGLIDAKSVDSFNTAFNALKISAKGKDMNWKFEWNITDSLTGAEKTTIEAIWAKTKGVEEVINAKSTTTHKNIILSVDTILSKDKVELAGNDKTELAEVIKGAKDATEAKALLKTIFKESEIDIDKLYDAIK